MTMRSPQKINTQPGKLSAWSSNIQGKVIHLDVNQEDDQALMNAGSGAEKQQLFERIYFDRQQQQLGRHLRSQQQQQQAAASSSTSNTASNATPNATANTASRTPLTKQHLQIRCLSQQ